MSARGSYKAVVPNRLNTRTPIRYLHQRHIGKPWTKLGLSVTAWYRTPPLRILRKGMVRSRHAWPSQADTNPARALSLPLTLL
eukprot:15766_1